MSKIRWEAKAAKRRLAKRALEEALEYIQAASGGGGETTAGESSWYARALMMVREAENLLRLTDGGK